MANCVRITIHHQECIFAPRDHQMRGVIACPSRCFEKIRVRFFPLEILDPPRAPKRFQFFFWKFRRHLRFRSPIAEAARRAVACWRRLVSFLSEERKFARPKVEPAFLWCPKSIRTGGPRITQISRTDPIAPVSKPRPSEFAS